MTRRKKRDQKLFFGHYIVAFIDLLGQQELLRNLRTLPNPEDPRETEDMKEILKKTYGAVSELRKFFNDAFEAYSKTTINLSALTRGQRKEFKHIIIRLFTCSILSGPIFK